MRHLSMLQLPKPGHVLTFNLGPLALVSSLMVTMALFVFGCWGGVTLYQAKHGGSLLFSMQSLFSSGGAMPAQDVVELRDQLLLEQKKVAVYARTLGQMEARLSRLDSLGSKLVSVAKLDKSEFDFSLQPAIGGPRVNQAAMMDLDEHLDDSLHFLDQKLGRIDAQLSVIDYKMQENAGEAMAKPHAWPTDGGLITSRYGARLDPFTGEAARHEGVDISNRYGAPVRAAAPGIVTFAGHVDDFGYMVEIDHGYGFTTTYGHMSSVIAKVGDVVKEGALVGRIGSTGRSTGPHLHYEVHLNGRVINPAGFLPRA